MQDTNTSAGEKSALYPLDPWIEGCDVPEWVPFMTADELGLDRPKMTIDYATGEEHVSYPAALIGRGIVADTSAAA